MSLLPYPVFSVLLFLFLFCILFLSSLSSLLVLPSVSFLFFALCDLCPLFILSLPLLTNRLFSLDSCFQSRRFRIAATVNR